MTSTHSDGDVMAENQPSADEKIGHEKYERLIAAAQKETTIKVAVAHPCDDVSLRSAIEAYKLGLVEPILVAPPERVRNAAKEADLDCAVLDVNLGGQPIFPLADLLRDRGAPFAFATGYGDAGLREVDRDSPVLQKPFREGDLARVLGELTAAVG